MPRTETARSGHGWFAVLVAAFLILLFPGAAVAANVVNGNFESGTLAGWHVHQVTGAGNWFAYEGTAAPIGSKRPTPADPIQAPPEGAHAAIADEANPDSLILYQDVALEAGYSHRLSLIAYYDSYEPIAIPTPDTLSVDEGVLGAQGNQQYRIDVMKPDAPIESVDPADILLTVFQTKRGDPKKMPPTRMTADLSPYAGQTVRLRIATAVHEEVLNAGVDAVSILSAAPGQPLPGGSKHGPDLFSFGKVTANRRNGTATLLVRVSGPGLLTAKGAPSSAHASKARKPRSPIRPATVRASAAGNVAIRLRPMPFAEAILMQRHKLRVLVAVTYTPSGGFAETATLPVVLRFQANSRHRS